jgi:hypothetical protein
MRTKMKWTKQEKGWYISDKGDGITKEDDGIWYFYPAADPGFSKKGPYNTLREAIEDNG